jgi:hypothetical protein
MEHLRTMDIATLKQKRRRLTIVLAAVGFAIAAVIWAYSELTASSSPPFNFLLSGAFIVVCPPSLLTIPLIDVEPGSMDFAVTWLIVGLLNSGLYGVIGIMIGKFCWKPDSVLLDGKGTDGPVSR